VVSGLADSEREGRASSRTDANTINSPMGLTVAMPKPRRAIPERPMRNLAAARACHILRVYTGWNGEIAHVAQSDGWNRRLV
jgi:hypothetical protein